jgi:hypothetical protein
MFLGVTGMLTAMGYTDEERQKIADLVSRARLAKPLDKESAATAAGVNSITWKRVEDALSVRDATLSKILKSLDLPAAYEILRGNTDVVVQPSPARIVLLSEVPTFDLLDELRNRVVPSSDDTERTNRLTALSERSLDAMRNHGRLDNPGHSHQQRG